jgi:hypothetical protein
LVHSTLLALEKPTAAEVQEEARLLGAALVSAAVGTQQDLVLPVEGMSERAPNGLNHQPIQQDASQSQSEQRHAGGGEGV